MYATARFQFSTTENGILMSGNAVVRGIFLIFFFPRIIRAGRRRVGRRSHSNHDGDALSSEDQVENRSTQGGGQPIESTGFADTEGRSKAPNEEDGGQHTFDLYFLRYSLVVDGFVTSASAFATQSWHMYLGMALHSYTFPHTWVLTI